MLAEDGKIVLVTNQVYANFKEKDRVEIVGGQMFKNWSGVLIELRKEEENIRKLVVVKPIEKVEDKKSSTVVEDKKFKTRRLESSSLKHSAKFKIVKEGFIAL